jgi:prepilin-type N-terminal cleavage/methylation domain-containing protein
MEQAGVGEEVIERSEDSGFTLIELMVVMVIISVLVSMVGPAMFKRIDKIRVSAEEKKLESILESAKTISFCRRSHVLIEFENNVLTIKNSAKETISSTEFEFLSFKKSLVRFNGNGFSDKKEIEYICDNRKKIIFLKQ